MKSILYTGGYLLSNPDSKSQFGIVDASADVIQYKPNIRIVFGKQILEKLQTDEDGSLTINLSLEESSKLSEILKKAENSIQLLITLSKTGKLKDEAYLIE